MKKAFTTIKAAMLGRPRQIAGRRPVVLFLILVAAVFACALDGSAARLILKEALAEGGSGEDQAAALSRLQKIEKGLEEVRHWGGMVAAMNPSLTSGEAEEIGSAVLKYSSQYGLSPRLIVAVIMVESSGRVFAVSPKGAEGLMQVMPFWKNELGIEGTLFDIDTNIRAGAHILAQYTKRYGFEEGIARYYRGTLPVSGDAYIGKVQKAMQSIS